MDKELTIIAEPEELIAWADTFDILLNPSIEDAAILLNYMEGHDYAIGIDSDGKMYRQDIAEENGEIEPYLIDDVIDIVCEWNYELILDAEAHRSDPKDFNDYNEYQSKYESLKADEKRLDTVYFRFLKILIIVPLGAIACSTMAGNRMVSHTMSTYCKYFLSCVFEAVTMALAIVVCNAFINAGLPAFTGSYADWAQTLIYLCEMTFTIAMTVGSVKGAQTLTSKAFGL